MKALEGRIQQVKSLNRAIYKVLLEFRRLLLVLNEAMAADIDCIIERTNAEMASARAFRSVYSLDVHADAGALQALLLGRATAR